MKDIMRDELEAPKIVDRSTFQAELDALLVREKASIWRSSRALAALYNVELVGPLPLQKCLPSNCGRFFPAKYRSCG